MILNHGFPKSARLLTSDQYSRVFNDVALRASSKHFLVLSRKIENCPAKLGVIVAKKHVKRAVDRNRLKRMIRESFRLNRSNLPPLDIIVLAKAGAGNIGNSECYSELDKVWHKLNSKYPKVS